MTAPADPHRLVAGRSVFPSPKRSRSRFWQPLRQSSALVCIEAHRQVRQQILDYFARHGYVALGKYLRIDPYNLYFAPLPR